MKSIIFVVVVLGLGFSEVLEIDSITDTGTWTNPDSILVSDDLYALTGQNQDVMTLSFADPTDTVDMALDSVRVYLEQHVNDPTRALWYVRPRINGILRTATPLQAGTLTDSVLCFDISGDITGWADLYDFEIDLHPKLGTGQQPEWYADYCYAYAYSHSITSVGEFIHRNRSTVLLMPTMIHSALSLTYNLDTSGNISLEIYNTLGMKVFSRELYSTEGVNTITLSEVGQFPSGIYYLSIKTDTGLVQPRKFIVFD